MRHHSQGPSGRHVGQPLAVTLIVGVVEAANAGVLQETRIAVCLENVGDSHPFRELFQLPRCHYEGHSVKSLLKLVFARISLVVDEVVVVLPVAAVLAQLRSPQPADRDGQD
jgi:hypothetical protein